MKKGIVLVLSILCIGMITANAQSKKELKEQKKEKEFAEIQELIASGNFFFDANAVYTQSGRRIDLTTNPGTLTFKDGENLADLPYFGVSQSAGYGDRTGITFEKQKTNYTIETNDKKHSVIIKFNANNSPETFNIQLTVFASGTANLNVSSSHRNFISYQGKIKPLPKKDTEN